MTKPMGSVGWLEHHSGSSEATKEFYNALIGYDSMMPMDMGDHNDYSAVLGDDAVFGIIQKFEGLENFTGWLPYLMVEDLDASFAKAVENGATEVLPVTRMGGGGYCVLKDPQGAMFGMFAGGGEGEGCSG